MIDLVWNFPLLAEQQELWHRYLTAAIATYTAQPVEAQRPSFRTVELALRERAARLLGFPVARTWITAGGHHGNLNALLASGLAATHFALEGNSYPGFIDQCNMTRTQMTAIAYDDLGVLPEALRTACEQSATTANPIRGFFTMPTVQNPLGFVTPLARRNEIVAIAREFDLTIIEDDTYGYMEQFAPANYAQLAPERTFYIRSLAKSFAPGARTGFLVGPESAQGAIISALKNTATGTDVPQNLAALQMMEDGAHDTLMSHKRTEGTTRNREARALLADIAGVTVSPGAKSAWHLWVNLPETIDPKTLARDIATRGVLLSSGHWCAVSDDYGRGVRIALGGEVDREQMLKGVSILADTLRSSTNL